MVCLTAGMLRPMVSSPTSSRYSVISIHFYDGGASILVCTLETHKMFVFQRFYHITLTRHLSQRMLFNRAMDVEVVKTNTDPHVRFCVVNLVRLTNAI